jgi:hypothetical protein
MSVVFSPEAFSLKDSSRTDASETSSVLSVSSSCLSSLWPDPIVSSIGPCEVEFPRLEARKFVFSKIDLKRGRSVARDATVIPVPGSIVDHNAIWDELSKKCPDETVMPEIYNSRIMEAMEPLIPSVKFHR